MDNIYRGGTDLTILILAAVLLIAILFNWGKILRFLIDGARIQLSLTKTILGSVTQVKVLLLKVSGASANDLSSNDGRYLSASNLGRTYFAENCLRCLWQLFSYYMVYCLVLVILAKPIDPIASTDAGKLIAFAVGKDAPAQIANIIILAVTNVITDLLSMSITFVHLSLIAKSIADKSYLNATGHGVRDVAIAFLLFSISQLVSNFLYPQAIDNPPSNFDPWSIKAALMPYAFMASASGTEQSFYSFTFPGQLFITGTVFVPTVLAMIFVLCLTVLMVLTRAVKRVQDLILDGPDISHGQSPDSIGGLEPRVYSRSDRCQIFAVNSMMAMLIAIIGGVSATYITKLLGLV